jgi:hypothetical protein
VNSQPSAEPPRIDEPQLRTSLDGVQFPAAKWQLLSRAEYNSAALPIRVAPWQLPERLYHNITDVANAVAKAVANAVEAGQRSRSRPLARTCTGIVAHNMGQSRDISKALVTRHTDSSAVGMD